MDIDATITRVTPGDTAFTTASTLTATATPFAAATVTTNFTPFATSTRGWRRGWWRRKGLSASAMLSIIRS